MNYQIVAFIALIAAVHAGLLGEGYGLEGGLNEGFERYSSNSGQKTALDEKETFVDFISVPKYEYKYAVDDRKTGDQKEQTESRVKDLTKSEYATAEKDRKIQVSRVIAGVLPVKIVGKY